MVSGEWIGKKEEKVICLPADSSAILMVDNVTGTVRLECILSIPQPSRHLFEANARGAIICSLDSWYVLCYFPMKNKC